MKKILLLGCTFVLMLSLTLLGGCAGNDDPLTDDPAAGQEQQPDPLQPSDGADADEDQGQPQLPQDPTQQQNPLQPQDPMQQQNPLQPQDDANLEN